MHTHLIERGTPPCLGAEFMCLIAKNPGNSAVCKSPGYFVFHLDVYVEDYLWYWYWLYSLQNKQ